MPAPHIHYSIYEVTVTTTGLLANIEISIDDDVQVLLNVPVPTKVAFGDQATQERWLAELPDIQQAQAANEA